MSGHFPQWITYPRKSQSKFMMTLKLTTRVLLSPHELELFVGSPASGDSRWSWPWRVAGSCREGRSCSRSSRGSCRCGSRSSSRRFSVRGCAWRGGVRAADELVADTTTFAESGQEGTVDSGWVVANSMFTWKTKISNGEVHWCSTSSQLQNGCCYWPDMH